VAELLQNMNAIAYIILFSLIILFLVNLIADLFNLNMASDKIPKAFENHYDKERYKTSQQYLVVNTRFNWLISLFGSAGFLIFWFIKGFPLLDRFIRSLNTGSVVAGLIFIGSLFFLKSILSLPFSMYSTFVIEERFGFNKTTWPVYIKDLLKVTALVIVIGTPLLSGILVFFEYFGKNAWLWCWAAATVYILTIQFLAPTFIMPLFNKFDPLEEGELKNAIFSYASLVDFPLKNVFVMDGSKRSKKSNAFFTGFGKNKRIVLFDTLVQKHTVSELVAILAHEIGHYKKKHILKSIILGVIETGVLFYLLSVFMSSQALFAAFFMEETSIYAGLVFFTVLYSPVSFITGILIQIKSRNDEFEADRFAVETTQDRNAFKEALIKLSVNNLSNLTPHPLYVFLNYSHPPVLERIKYITSI
jgi:STE24 endopeptidase